MAGSATCQSSESNRTARSGAQARKSLALTAALGCAWSVAGKIIVQDKHEACSHENLLQTSPLLTADVC